MASTAFVADLRVIILILTTVVGTWSTSSFQSSCTSESTCQHGTVQSIVKTVITPRGSNPKHDADIAAACVKSGMEITNHITINLYNQQLEKVATGAVSTIKREHDSRTQYKLFDGIGYYRLHETRKTWAEAQRTCNQEGSYLAVISSKQEEEIIKKLLYMDPIAYIGFRYVYLLQGGNYITVLGEPLNATGYVNWEPGAELGAELSGCGAVWYTGEITSFSCDSQLPFICEMPV